MADDDKKIDVDMENLSLEKKKKKKTKKPVEDGGPDLDLGGKKEKKKKTKKPAGGDGDTGGAAPELDLGEKKKKPKKKKTGDDEAAAPGLELGDKKPKKKKEKGPVAKERVMEELDESQMASYQYEDLLYRVFDKMESMGVGKGSKGSKRIVCKPPLMVRIGTKKSGYQNFGTTCEALSRSTKHVMQYILAETGTSGNLDITNQLILRGRFKPAHMENILREYIKEYVQCATCKSANTILDKIDRLTFMNCHDCSSRRTVLAMNAGFQAITGKRKKLREKDTTGKSNAMATAGK